MYLKSILFVCSKQAILFAYSPSGKNLVLEKEAQLVFSNLLVESSNPISATPQVYTVYNVQSVTDVLDFAGVRVRNTIRVYKQISVFIVIIIYTCTSKFYSVLKIHQLYFVHG